MIKSLAIFLIRLHNWTNNARTGYEVSIYDTELKTYIRAQCLGGGRYVVRHEKKGWEIRTVNACGYDACKEAEEWFKTLENNGIHKTT